MAARDRTNGSDSGRVDDNDFVPNSQSEQDDDDVPLALVDEVFDDEEIEDSETEEDIDAYMPKIKFGKARNKKRRQPKRKTNARNKKRCRMGRNKTHASKRGCCDMEEIKRCLDSKKKCCGKSCLRKLAERKEEAVKALAELRHQRFAGQFNAHHEKCRDPRSHPGVKNNS